MTTHPASRADGDVGCGHHPVPDEHLDIVDEGEAEVAVHVVTQVHMTARRRMANALLPGFFVVNLAIRSRL
ncbi:hypothetical protein ACIHFC_13440 [Streptomyces sp. NPDC052013]|uniref:hypothetical protein n=1 Tax=Streptomyces sp. NPDC052013 TaxID=3365679 RepID=UPI0037D5C456